MDGDPQLDSFADSADVVIASGTSVVVKKKGNDANVTLDQPF